MLLTSKYIKEEHNKIVKKYLNRIQNTNRKANRLTNVLTNMQVNLKTANQIITKVEITKIEYKKFLSKVSSQTEKQKIKTIWKLHETNYQLTKKDKDLTKQVYEATKKCIAIITVNTHNKMMFANY